MVQSYTESSYSDEIWTLTSPWKPWVKFTQSMPWLKLQSGSFHYKQNNQPNTTSENLIRHFQIVRVSKISDEWQNQKSSNWKYHSCDTQTYVEKNLEKISKGNMYIHMKRSALHKSVKNNEITFMRLIVVTIQYTYSTEKVLGIDFPHNDTFLNKEMKRWRRKPQWNSNTDATSV